MQINPTNSLSDLIIASSQEITTGTSVMQEVSTQLEKVKLVVEKTENSLFLKDDSVSDPCIHIPAEIMVHIFSYLNPSELANSCRVSKDWFEIANDKGLWEFNHLISSSIIGKEDIEKCFGKVKEVPPLPKGLYRLLDSPDPVCPQEKKKKNWKCVLIPDEVDGKPFRLKLMGELSVKNKVHTVGYFEMCVKIIENDEKTPVEPTHWILIRLVNPESRNLTVDSQEELVEDYSKQAKVKYLFPSIRAAVVYSFAALAKYGKAPYGIGPVTLTRCRKEDSYPGFRHVVGELNELGLDVNYTFNEHMFPHVGVSLVQKFETSPKELKLDDNFNDNTNVLVTNKKK